MNYFDLLKTKIRQSQRMSHFIIDGATYDYQMIYDACRLLDLPKGDLFKGQSVFIQASDLYDQLLLFFYISNRGGIPILLHQQISHQMITSIGEQHHIPFLVTKSQFNTEVNVIALVTPRPVEKSDSRCFGVLSSGSTGVPKVMYRSYKSWASFFDIQNEIFKVDKESVVFLQGSLSFTANLNLLLSSIFAGATVVMESSLYPKRWIHLIKQQKVSVLYLVPTKLDLLLRNLTEPKEGIESIIIGSQPLSKWAIQSIQSYFPQALVQLYYGASEVSFVTYLSLEELMDHPMRVGKPFPNVFIQFNQEEILVQTPYTIEGIKGPYATKDLGYLDQDGYLNLKGRSDSVVNVSGNKVNLLKIEREIRSQDQILDVVVGTRPHLMKGEEVIALIVVTPKFKRAVFLSALNQRLVLFERPQHLKVVSHLPRNDSGKISQQEWLNLIKDIQKTVV